MLFVQSFPFGYIVGGLQLSGCKKKNSNEIAWIDKSEQMKQESDKKKEARMEHFPALTPDSLHWFPSLGP